MSEYEYVLVCTSQAHKGVTSSTTTDANIARGWLSFDKLEHGQHHVVVNRIIREVVATTTNPEEI